MGRERRGGEEKTEGVEMKETGRTRERDSLRGGESECGKYQEGEGEGQEE